MQGTLERCHFGIEEGENMITTLDPRVINEYSFFVIVHYCKRAEVAKVIEQGYYEHT